MTVKELENMLGMSRANIRYYEQEHLIEPKRQANGYRDYSVQDVEQLKKIKLLRELGVSLADIKRLQTGELVLAYEMQQRIQLLESQQGEAWNKQQICRAIQQENIAYQRLDADKYLNGTYKEEQLSDAAGHGAQLFLEEQYLQEDCPVRILPVRRFVARLLDQSLYYGVAVCVISLLHKNYMNFNQLFLQILGMLFGLFVEPLCICLTGRTIGKWVFGLHLEDVDGKRPSYHAAFVRTARVLFYGMGLQIPLVRLYRFYKSYCTLDGGCKLPWEDGLEYVQKTVRLDECSKFYAICADGKWRYGMSLCVWLAWIAVLYGFILYARIPVNRGQITLEDFAENYNQIADYYGYSDGLHQMKPDGTFYTVKELEQQPDGMNQAVIYLDGSDNYRFNFEYICDGDMLKEVSLYIDMSENPMQDIIPYPRAQMAIAVLAFAGAQENVGFWNDERGHMAQKLLGDEMDGFSYRMGGMEAVCDAEYNGYEKVFGKSLIVSGKDNKFQLKFKIN